MIKILQIYYKAIQEKIFHSTTIEIHYSFDLLLKLIDITKLRLADNYFNKKMEKYSHNDNLLKIIYKKYGLTNFLKLLEKYNNDCLVFNEFLKMLNKENLEICKNKFSEIYNFNSNKFGKIWFTKK